MSDSRDGGGQSRVIQRVGAGEPIAQVGLARRPLSDLYHFLVTSRWSTLVVLVLGGYLAANALFAAAYLALGDVIENARPGSFTDAFFFSVQTMATIGYGQLTPRTLAANALATLEVIVGAMGLAVMAGLVFAKFARPTARVLFSRVAVVAPHEGVPSLMFRMANARASHIVEARVTVMLVRSEAGADGEEVGVHDLELRRSHSPLFALTWTAVHPITPASPLAREDAASLARSQAEVVVSLVGFDESLAQSVHARHAYRADQILWGVRLREILRRRSSGRLFVDYRKFHDVVPVDGAAPPRARRRGGG